MTVRIAFIGMGDMGSGHARGFDRLDSCQVVAVADTNLGWANTRPVDWTRTVPPTYTNYLQMLEETKPNAVVISVPDYLHRGVAEQCLSAGCDVLLEKPVATTLEDCDAITAAADRHKRILQIGLVYRYSTLYRTMASRSHAGAIGPVRLMWCKELRQCLPQKEWFYEQTKCGGTLVEKDCHHFDIFNWVIDSKPVCVSAFGGQHVYRHGEPVTINCSYTPEPPLVKSDIDTVDHAVVNVQYENGAVASLVLCMYLQPQNEMPEGLEIGGVGLNGMQMCAYRDNRLGVGGLGQEWTWLDYDAAADSQGLGHIGCQQERIEFIECVRNRTRPFADAAVGRASLLVALAAEKSIQTGRPIDIRSGFLE